jgi:hypothetical protein
MLFAIFVVAAAAALHSPPTSVTVTVACTPIGGDGGDIVNAVVSSLAAGCYASDDCRPFAQAVSRAGGCAPSPVGTTECILASARGGGSSGLLPATAYLWYSLVQGLVDNARTGSGSWCGPVNGVPDDPFVRVLVSVLAMTARDRALAPSLTRSGGGGADLQALSHDTSWKWSYAPEAGADSGAGFLSFLDDAVVYDRGRVCVGTGTLTGSALFHVATLGSVLVVIMWLVGQVRRIRLIVNAERAMHAGSVAPT